MHAVRREQRHIRKITYLVGRDAGARLVLLLPLRLGVSAKDVSASIVEPRAAGPPAARLDIRIPL